MSETEHRRRKPAREDDVAEAMHDVVDPELGINVVDLGLIYGVHIDDDQRATIDMTLTSAACPLTDVIEDQATSALDGIGQRRRRSTGSGCRRGARTRSPTTAASSCGRSASTSDPEGPRPAPSRGRPGFTRNHDRGTPLRGGAASRGRIFACGLSPGSATLPCMSSHFAAVGFRVTDQASFRALIAGLLERSDAQRVGVS